MSRKRTKEPVDTPLTRAILAHIERSGESAHALSVRLGRASSFVRKIFEGVTPRGGNLIDLAAAIGRRPEELIEGDAVMAPDAPPPAPRISGDPDVPVFGVAEGGSEGAFIVNSLDPPMDWAPRPERLRRAAQVFAVTIQGESMEPVWRSGDLVYCQAGRGYGPGDYVLVQIEAGPGKAPLAFLKQFVRRDDEQLVLAQHNPPAEMTVERDRVKEITRAFHWRELGN